MGAGQNAKPLGYKGWQNGISTYVRTEQEAREFVTKHRFKCSCGTTGNCGELLADDGYDTLYCPDCRLAAWEWE